ncbi:DUF2019 domain-containing protein [Mesorhizobium sp. VNQ89]|uniref:DUF2019 domain-containing protein n=1 Tax=Mesorhizobium quangtriensis TaxID=3157709 RepID=UPI0032B81E9F
MKKRPEKMSLEELVASFVEIGVAQSAAAEEFRISTFNKLYDRKKLIINELRRRDNDQRRLLIALYDHPNIQVRLNAAKSTYALNTQGARAVIQAIADTKIQPWAGSAGMTLWSLDEGLGKLD